MPTFNTYDWLLFGVLLLTVVVGFAENALGAKKTAQLTWMWSIFITIFAIGSFFLRS